jgi:hypothetical protein
MGHRNGKNIYTSKLLYSGLTLLALGILLSLSLGLTRTTVFDGDTGESSLDVLAATLPGGLVALATVDLHTHY